MRRSLLSTLNTQHTLLSTPPESHFRLVSWLAGHHSLPVTMTTTDTTVPPGSAEVPATIPPLPENATPEEKDAHWFAHVYAGDKSPQLTLRAVLMGGILGMAM